MPNTSAHIDLVRDVVALGEELNLWMRTGVKAGQRRWGPTRTIHVVASAPADHDHRLGMECRSQSVGGTTETKIAATLWDFEEWPIDGIVVIRGYGFSKDFMSFVHNREDIVHYDLLEDFLRSYFAL